MAKNRAGNAGDLLQLFFMEACPALWQRPPYLHPFMEMRGDPAQLPVLAGRHDDKLGRMQISPQFEKIFHPGKRVVEDQDVLRFSHRDFHEILAVEHVSKALLEPVEVPMNKIDRFEKSLVHDLLGRFVFDGQEIGDDLGKRRDTGR